MVVSGASRTGKTAWVMSQVDGPRVIVWDPEDQWSRLPGYKRVINRQQLLNLTVYHAELPGRLAFVAGGDLEKAFQYWANCAFYWGRFGGPCTVVAEEIADVTTPGKAPGRWGVLIRRGLKRGIDIYAISQRWAESDKTAIGNASQFVIFRPTPADVAYVAKKTGADPAQLQQLRGHQHLTLDNSTGAATVHR